MSQLDLSKTSDVAAPAASGIIAACTAESRNGALYALALGTFAVGTEGFMTAAILPTISD